jgi:tetratricopeptide (TPR) repeat protein
MDIRRVEGLSEAGDTPTEDLIERLGAIKSDATEAEDWEAVALALDVELKLLQMAGNLDGVRALCGELQGIISSGEALALVTAHLVLALALLQQDPEKAVASAREAVALSRRVSPDGRLTALNRLLIVFYHRGLLQLPENQLLISEARALAENTGDLLQRVCFESNMGAWHLDAGDLDRAEVLIRKADRLLGSADMTFTRINLACNLGELAIARGDFHSATAAFESAGSHGGLTIPRYTSNFVNAGLGLCALELGSLSHARRFEQALDDPPEIWSYDPTVIVAFRSRLMERRGQGSEAIEVLSLAAEGLKDRLVMASLKIRAMEVKLMLKLDAPGAYAVAAEALQLSEALQLKHRANEFSAMLQGARDQ